MVAADSRIEHMLDSVMTPGASLDRILPLRQLREIPDRPDGALFLFDTLPCGISLGLDDGGNAAVERLEVLHYFHRDRTLLDGPTIRSHERTR
jgi:hypothetical protein